MRSSVLSLALLSGCFLFEPSGPPPQHPEPLPPGHVAAATTTATGWTPDDDRDRDGIPDARDRCPDDPEDRDGFEDDDGCPEPDNDKDGIEDRCDRCPNDPETFNGFQDEDGCPDRPLIRLQSSSIRILQHAFFGRGQTRPIPGTQPLLDEIARVLQDHPEIELIACLGHASGDEPQAELLSMKRAQEIRAQLIQRGVDGNRLVPLAAGARLPLAPENSPSSREKNRRVEMQILAIAGEEIRRWNGQGFDEIPSTTPPRSVTPPSLPGCP
jgi:outer membrane protein OmpA-like peptidoglycan-associated protein